MQPIERGDLLITENAELEVREIRDGSLAVVDEHNDHFEIVRETATTNLMRGAWERVASADIKE